MRDLYLVAYDVRHPTRLRKILKILKDFASGGQKSAFECYLTAAEKRELRQRALSVIDISEDSLLLMKLKSRTAVITMGRAVPPRDEQYTYLG